MHSTRKQFLLGLITSPALLASSVTTVNSQNENLNTVSSSTDLSRLLRCIAEVETGNNDALVGVKGERSRYQITKTVWLQHPHCWQDGKQCPFLYCYALNGEKTAELHLRWLDRHLPPCTRPFWLAFAWRAGLERTLLELRGASVTTTFYRYARRVTNLYDDATFHPRS